jgi:hypothetical protein
MRISPLSTEEFNQYEPLAEKYGTVFETLALIHLFDSALQLFFFITLILVIVRSPLPYFRRALKIGLGEGSLEKFRRKGSLSGTA